MSTKTLGTAAVLIGVVLIVAAMVLRFAIVPGMLQLPADTDETRNFEGTMHRLLSPEALAAEDIPNLFIEDVDVELTRRVFVEATDGGDALIREEARAVLADGTVVAEQTDAYSVDRRTMEHSDAFAGTDGVLDREGLVIGWPIGTEQRDYQGWSDDLQSTVTATYERQEQVDGVETYVFTSEIPPSVITDPVLLATLPTDLTKATLTQLALAAPGDLPLPLGDMAAIVAELPDPVPLTYVYSGSTTYWVEPTTGVVVDIDRTETRETALTPASMPEPLALTAVFDWTYQASDGSVADAIASATDAADQITLFGTTVPFTLIGIGVVLLVGGLLLRRRDTDGTDPTTGPPAVIALDEAKAPASG